MYSLIRSWEASGLSQDQFFHKHGLAKSTFGYWRKKYLRDKARSKMKENFIPVKVDQDHEKSDHQAGTLELVYPNGIRLVCSEAMELSRLKPLIVL
jgi:hypothetical protein